MLRDPRGEEAMMPVRTRYTSDPRRLVRKPALRPEQHMVIGDYYRARQGFPSDAELARVIGVHRSRVTAWKNGEMPDPENARLLAALAYVVSDLLRFMMPEVVPSWLRAPKIDSQHRTPIELLREGDLTEVLQLANATEYGAYV